MSDVESSPARLSPRPIPGNLTSVQPGGGFCYRVELAWGRWRRWYLKTFCKRYVQRMAELRQGRCSGAPHEILDPRDLKYCRNQCECDWDTQHDPFRWRAGLPFARWGLAELQLMGYPLAAIAVAAAWRHWWLAVVPLVLLAFVVSFFRDPKRTVPEEAGLLVSPADGTVVEVAEVQDDAFVAGPAVRVSIFLSIFNVHVNRSPAAAEVIELRYSPGKFLDARDPASATLNESLWIGLQETASPGRRLVVRQVAGLIARRIVCNLRSGERIERGHKFGMIKFGSRTELVFPVEDGLQVTATVGQRVRAGATVLARYRVA